MLRKKNWRRFITIGIIFIILIWMLFNLSTLDQVVGQLIGVSSPFIIGFAMAFILNIPMKFMEDQMTKRLGGKFRSWYRIITVILSFLFIGLIIALMIFLVLPDLQNTLSYFISAVPGQVNQLIGMVTNFIESNPQMVEYVQNMNLDWNSIQSNLINSLRGIITGFAGTIVNYVPTIINSVFDFVVSIIFAIYLLFSKESLIRQVKKLLYGIMNIPWANFFVNFGKITNKIFSAFVGGQVAAGILTGIVLYLLMKIFGFPYALSISVITAFFTLTPFYGAIFGGAVGFLLIAVVSFPQALWFVVLIVIVQQIEGNILYPKVVGDSIGIPGIWVMVTVTIGGALYGLVGMFLSVPLFSIVYNLLSQNINHRLNKEHLSIEYDTHNLKKNNK